MTTKFTKSDVVLQPYDADIRKILADNSVREMQEAEDKMFAKAVDDAIEAARLKPPFWKWFDRDVVHMTGLVFLANLHVRKTVCGILPENINYPTSDHPGAVSCLSCLAL